MVGMSIESLPAVASAVGGILILAMLVAGVVYGWWLDEKKSRQTTAGELLKKAA